MFILFNYFSKQVSKAAGGQRKKENVTLEEHHYNYNLYKRISVIFRNSNVEIIQGKKNNFAKFSDNFQK